eukprot:7235584-Pyramimonas_sp.AAC.1
MRRGSIGGVLISLREQPIFRGLVPLVSCAEALGLPLAFSCYKSVSEDATARLFMLPSTPVLSHMCRYKGASRLSVATFISNISHSDANRLELQCPGARVRDGHARNTSPDPAQQSLSPRASIEPSFSQF